jgi:hypothetical protein
LAELSVLSVLSVRVVLRPSLSRLLNRSAAQLDRSVADSLN